VSTPVRFCSQGGEGSGSQGGKDSRAQGGEAGSEEVKEVEHLLLRQS